MHEASQSPLCCEVNTLGQCEGYKAKAAKDERTTMVVLVDYHMGLLDTRDRYWKALRTIAAGGHNEHLIDVATTALEAHEAEKPKTPTGEDRQRYLDCPAKWCQANGRPKPGWDMCAAYVVCDRCPDYPARYRCWARWDRERADEQASQQQSHAGGLFGHGTFSLRDANATVYGFDADIANWKLNMHRDVREKPYRDDDPDKPPYKEFEPGDTKTSGSLDFVVSGPVTVVEKP